MALGQWAEDYLNGGSQQAGGGAGTMIVNLKAIGTGNDYTCEADAEVADVIAAHNAGALIIIRAKWGTQGTPEQYMEKAEAMAVVYPENQFVNAKMIDVINDGSSYAIIRDFVQGSTSGWSFTETRMLVAKA